METPVLDLATLVERPTIAIDGCRYEILSHDELTAVDLHLFEAAGRRIEALMGSEELPEADQEALRRLIVKTSERVMVGVPPEVAAKLSDTQRLAVLEVFTQLPALKVATKMMATGAAATGAKSAGKGRRGKSTGGKRPRGSSASTAASPGGGSPAARSGS